MLKQVFIFIFIMVALPGAYIWNFYKLSNCDFEPNYKCEIIHGSGAIFFPVSVVTVWFGDDIR